jgi:arginase
MGAPLYTLAAYKGMGEAPGSLRRARIARALAIKADLGDVELPPLKGDILEGTVKNLTYFKDASKRIYDITKSAGSEKVIVIGGECSETVAALAGFSGTFGGRAGMLWLDAHGDFNTPTTSPSGYIGGMCLAMACGRVPELGLEFGFPLADERLVHVGSRALDPPEVAAFNSSPAKLYTAQQVKKTGAADVAEEAARHLDNRSDWVACHLDIDVVDPEFIPAVNYPTPGGLTPEETTMLIRALHRTGKMKVLEVAAYNSSKDRRHASADRVVTMLRSIFA